MRYRVEISAKAQLDLDRIYRYIHGETSESAAKWFDGLHRALISLSKMPQRSPLARERPLLRHLLYGKKPHIYRAIYLIDEDRGAVMIVAIRHGARAPLRTKER